MSEKQTIKTREVELSEMNYWNLANNGSQIYSIDVLKSTNVLSALDFIRDKMQISFGMGVNDTFYLITEGFRPEINHYYNLPLNITYNNYSRDIQVTEFFPRAKLRELNDLTHTHMGQIEWGDSDETVQLPAFSDSERTYLELRSWVSDESNHASEYYDRLANLYLTVTQQFKFKFKDNQHYPSF